MDERPPPLPPELVRQFVIAGHGDLALVNRMLDEHPTLINACWDWGGGDYETALGGAAHVGRRDIAERLLARGARFDLYAAAMLGQLEAVKAVLEAVPEARHATGAHGLSLLFHAEQGGEAAKEVAAHLRGLEG
jgi:hypothetical protein